MTVNWIPNALTLLRCGLAIAIGFAILETDRQMDAVILDTHTDMDARRAGFQSLWFVIVLPFILFLIAGLTDFLDGFLARRWQAQSAFGAFLDPIADKLLVAIALLAICKTEGWWLVLLVPSLAIIVRDIGVTLLRIINRRSPALSVSNLSKRKTALEMAAIAGFLGAIALFAVSGIAGMEVIQTGLSALAIAALYLASLLALYTGWAYVEALGKP